jgi:hypothetical protein
MGRLSLILSVSWLAGIRGLSSPPQFTMNMSATPIDRWNGALDLVAEVSSWEESWLPVFLFHNYSIFDRVDESMWEQMATSLTSYHPDQADELRGLSSQFMEVYGQYVSFEYLVGWVYFHELAHSDLAIDATAVRPECTAILSQNEVKKKEPKKYVFQIKL